MLKLSAIVLGTATFFLTTFHIHALAETSDLTSDNTVAIADQNSQVEVQEFTQSLDDTSTVTQSRVDALAATPAPVTYAHVYSVMDQDISAAGTVVFENINTATASFDLTMASTTGEVKFLKSGIYRLQFTVQGGLTPPLPQPIPDWAFALYINGSHVPGSTFGAFTHSPDDRPQCTGGEVIASVMEGDILTLQSTSIAPVSLNGPIFGSLEPLVSGSISIYLLAPL